MLQYFLPMILCIAVSYIGMFGYFKLFDDEQSSADVVAIATAPPRIVTNDTQGANAQDIVCVPTIHIDNNMEAIPQQTQTCFSSMSKPP